MTGYIAENQELKVKLAIAENHLTRAVYFLQHHCDGHKEILQGKNKLLQEMGLLKSAVK